VSGFPWTVSRAVASHRAEVNVFTGAADSFTDVRLWVRPIDPNATITGDYP